MNSEYFEYLDQKYIIHWHGNMDAIVFGKRITADERSYWMFLFAIPWDLKRQLNHGNLPHDDFGLDIVKKWLKGVEVESGV